MTYSEFRELVQRMMDAQAAYFKARKQGLVGLRELETSKLLERDVRAELKKPRDGQGTLDF
jgi:hypothetical protein